MKISESQLRKEIRNILLAEGCCCQKKKLINEIERGSSLVFRYTEWKPGTCEIDFSRIPGFEKLFLGDKRATSVDGAIQQMTKDSTLAKFLPNTASELSALRFVLGEIINNVDMALNIMGVPAVACYWIQRAIDLFAEVIGIGSDYISRGTTPTVKKPAVEVEKEDKTGIVKSIASSITSTKGKEKAADVVIKAAKKAPIPQVKAAATVADVVTERKLNEQAEVEEIFLPAGFANVFPEALISNMDLNSLDKDIDNYLKVTDVLSNIETEDAQAAYKQIAALNDIQVDARLMNSLPNSDGYDITEELKEKAIAGRKIAIAELLPQIAKALVDTTLEEPVMNKMREFINQLQNY